jgi:hypothetical protein
MSARATSRTAGTEPEETPRQTDYGVPSPALLARADRGFARFLEGVTEPEDEDIASGHADAARHP